MSPAAIRDRRARSRVRGATVLAVVVAASLALVIQRWRAPDAAERGFQLDQGASRAVVDDGLPPLDHPVPDDLRANVPPDGAIPAAMEGEDWFVGGFQVAQGWSFELDTVWRPISIFPMLDFRGEGLSVRQGIRPTWQPPPCPCPTVRLWMYGGSTTYGLNQRDDHTIASELARIAHRDGLRLEIANHGVLGYTHWLEAERFGHDLTLEAPPDVVVFYDGVNDSWATNIVNNRRSGDLAVPIDPTNIDVWSYAEDQRSAPPPAPPGATLIGWDRGEVLGLAELAELTLARYDRSRRISARLAEQHGVEAIYAWQPSRYSRDLVPAEPHADASQETYNRLRDQLQRAALPADVVDLVDAFDGNVDPIFTDDVHHNEAGARIVAEALYSEIEPDLRRIAEQRGGGR